MLISSAAARRPVAADMPELPSVAEPPRLLVIGLDGATLDLIRPWAERGELPVLSGLMARGSWGVLQSTTHPITPQAWTTFMTGVNAGQHGIFGFTTRKTGSYESQLLNASAIRSPTIWRRLSEAGLRVGVIAVPFTYPPESVNGFLLSGFDAPVSDRRAFAPPELYDEVMREVGPYLLHETFPVGRRFDLSAYRADVERTVFNRTAIGLHLMARHPTDLLTVVFTSTDHVQHLFWRDMEKGEGDTGRIILDTYRLVDAAVGRLLEAAGPRVNVVVMSDHGAGALEKVFYLDQWLEDQGLLSRRRAGLASSAKGLRAALKRGLPTGARTFLRARFPGLRQRARSLGEFSEVDWPHTRVYSEGMYGNLFVNLKGREPEGVVAAGAEYERLLDEITEKLLDLKDPDSGEAAVSQVFRKEDLYAGPCLHLAPDLIIGWRDYAYYTSKQAERRGGDWFGEELRIDSSDYPHTGTHRLEGTLIMAGPAFKVGGRISASLLDLAPTILHVLGQPVPDHAEGRVLREALADDNGERS